MNKQCEIVRDLLPLYIDDACSSASAQLVEEHIAECGECAELQLAMKSDKYSSALELEKENIIARHTRMQKRKSLVVGACIAGVLCIPVIVCLIVNLALGQALDWFFIVLTALMTVASLVVVPLIAEKQKGLYTIFSFTGSLLLLLLSCALYTGGDWLFVAVSSVLFGLSVIIMPYIAYALYLPKFWKKNKGLFSLGIDTLLFTVMMICIGLFLESAEYWSVMPPIALCNVGVVWLIFLICRYLSISRFIRAGLVSVISGIYLFFINNIIQAFNPGITTDSPLFPELYLTVWNDSTINGNVRWLILIGCAAVGAVCIIIGIVRDLKRKR